MALFDFLKGLIGGDLAGQASTLASDLVANTPLADLAAAVPTDVAAHLLAGDVVGAAGGVAGDLLGQDLAGAADLVGQAGGLIDVIPR